MARIKALPGLDIIKGFRGTLDFALWKGLPYVRRWPRTPRHHLTPATLAAAALFGEILKSYRLLADTIYEAFQEDAADQPRIPRDIFISATYGKLHEATMSDFLTLLTECRDSLALLEGLLATLRSVATDTLQVRGQDQLISIDSRVNSQWTGPLVGDNGQFKSGSPPDGKYWLLSTVTAWNAARPTTRIRMAVHDGTNTVYFREKLQAMVADEICEWTGQITLQPLDVVQVYFVGGLSGDACYIRVNGIQMTVET